MRTEASLEQWKTLYALAKEFKKRKPWKQLGNLDILKLSLPNAEPVYVTVMGNGGERFGFSMYIGEQGLNKLRLMVCKDEVND